MNYSLRLTGASTSVDLRVKPLPTPKVTRNVTWEQRSNGSWLPCDRGVAGDFWDVDVTVFGPKAEMDTFAQWLNDEGKGAFSIAAVEGSLFAPLLFQESAFNACILDLDRLKRVFWSSPTNGVDEVSFTLRALSPSFYDVASSLASLRLQDRDERDSSWDSTPNFYETGGVVYQDTQSRAGRYVGRFLQTTSEARQILRYLVTGSGRTSAVAFPNIGVEYPFGIARGVYTANNCRIKGFSLRHFALDWWEFEIEFVEEV